MTQDYLAFKAEMDDWIKSLNADLGKVRHIPGQIRDVHDNIDHNYELILEMRKEIATLREELSALRMVQLLHLKKELNQA